MAPCPEEVNVFSIPHSRMKHLVHRYFDLVSNTNFSNDQDFETLLQNLSNTFNEFKTHEHIENTYIMKKLRNKLKALSIYNSAVCNCHKDSHLTQMIQLFRDGKKSGQDRANYHIKLLNALEDFTQDFLPHMKEEEEVFQPLLLKYFSYEELCRLREEVVEKHILWQDEKEDEEEKKLIEDQKETEEVSERAPLFDLPDEITMVIFSHLSPRDLSRSAQVCKDWQRLALDPSLWREIHPVKWAQGLWNYRRSRPERGVAEEEKEEEEGGDSEEEMEEYQVPDEDADIDESSDTECSETDSAGREVHQEAKMLSALSKHLLPVVGHGVQFLNLANSKGLTTTVMNRILSHTPNVEYLDLTQTRITDGAFKSMGRSGCGSKLKSVVLSGCGNITDLAIERLSKGLESAPCRPPDTPDDSQEAKETHPSVSDKCVCKKTTKFVCRRKEGCSTPNLCAQKNVTVLNDEPYGRLCCKDRRTNTGNSKYRTFSPSICHDNAHNETYGQGADNPELWGVKYGVEEKTCSAPPHGESFSSESCHQVAPAVAVPDASCHASCSHEHAAGGLGCIEDCAPQVHLGRHFVSSLTTEEEDDTWPCGTRPAATGTSGGRALRLLNLSGCYLITDEGLSALCSGDGLPLLEYLDLSGCPNLTAAGLHQLVAACPSLEDQCLYYCDNIMDGPYASTANGCQNLECTNRVCCRSGF